MGEALFWTYPDDSVLIPKLTDVKMCAAQESFCVYQKSSANATVSVPTVKRISQRATSVSVSMVRRKRRRVFPVYYTSPASSTGCSACRRRIIRNN